MQKYGDGLCEKRQYSYLMNEYLFLFMKYFVIKEVVSQLERLKDVK